MSVFLPFLAMATAHLAASQPIPPPPETQVNICTGPVVSIEAARGATSGVYVFLGSQSCTVTARLLPRLMRLDGLDDFRVVDDGLKEVIPFFR
jgi:hypothetical protein